MRRHALAAAVDRLRASSAEMLSLLAAETGDGRFSSAAAILRGRRPGRRPMNDAESLAAARTLMASGLSDRAAATMVSLASPGHSLSATRDRIRRKLRRKTI
jgi:hypothetical protein